MHDCRYFKVFTWSHPLCKYILLSFFFGPIYVFLPSSLLYFSKVINSILTVLYFWHQVMCLIQVSQFLATSHTPGSIFLYCSRKHLTCLSCPHCRHVSEPYMTTDIFNFQLEVIHLLSIGCFLFFWTHILRFTILPSPFFQDDLVT